MTLSWPSALAAATRASMPPPAWAEVSVAQLAFEAPPAEPEAVEEEELLLQAEAASVTAAAGHASLAMRCIRESAFCELERGGVHGVSLHAWSVGAVERVERVNQCSPSSA